jgi:hypothetical protein
METQRSNSVGHPRVQVTDSAKKTLAPAVVWGVLIAFRACRH